MRSVCIAFVLASFVLVASSVRAQSDEDPPPIAAATSGEPSLLSGRTLGTGEVMVAGAAGWPWIWAQLEMAPSSSVNVGVRVALLYGSPIMALEAGAGAELSVPLRFHVYGEGMVDVSIFATPAFVFAEGAAVGEGGPAPLYAGDFGWSSRLEAGGVLGLHLAEKLTMIVGLGGTIGFVHVPDAGEVTPIGALFGRLGVEGLISRDTMLFALAESGVGFSPSRARPTPAFGDSFPPMLRVSLGVAYLF